MIIKFNIFQNNNINDLIINTYKYTVKDLIKYLEIVYNYDIETIYENNNKLLENFNKWNDSKKYTIITKNNDYINIKIKINDSFINLPKLEINTKVIDIKNILSIKDDIFYMNIKLNDNKTLLYYKIKNNSTLYTDNTRINISTRISLV
jgi:hypothetical protein